MWEFYKRRRLDETQRLTVEAMMALGPDDRWAAATTGREMPRQNGKGDEIEVPEFWGLTQRRERILHTVHDAVLLATETQQRMLSLFDHKDLRGRLGVVWRGTGQQKIEVVDGGTIWYRTRTGGGARGVDEVDRIVVDEAQHAEEEHLAAITPTQLASSNPQLNALGSAGIAGKSRWWWRQRRRALAGGGGRFGYVGHTAEQIELDANGRGQSTPIDVTDRRYWWQANPALAAGRVGEDFFAEQLETLGPELFGREHLGIWDPEPGDGGSLALPEWLLCAASDASPSSIVSHRQWALAVSPDRKWGAVGVAGRRADGDLHVEWMAHRSLAGWDPVADIAAGFKNTGVPIRVHKTGPEASFIGPLRAAGVGVVEVSTVDVAQATGQLIDAVASHRVHHLGQPSLDKAVAGAVLKLGSDGASVWSQKQSTVEITPLQAVTVALGGVPVEPEKKRSGVVW